MVLGDLRSQRLVLLDGAVDDGERDGKVNSETQLGRSRVWTSAGDSTAVVKNGGTPAARCSPQAGADTSFAGAVESGSSLRRSSAVRASCLGVRARRRVGSSSAVRASRLGVLATKRPERLFQPSQLPPGFAGDPGRAVRCFLGCSEEGTAQVTQLVSFGSMASPRMNHLTE